VKPPVCLITGGTDGVGKVTAIELARRGYTVVLAARSASKAQALVKEIAASTGNVRTEFIPADLASLRQVRRLAEAFQRRHGALDVLVNNAGVFLGARTETEDGFETTFQVNYLSHFLLTSLLLGALKSSDQGRVINLSSSVYSMGVFEPDDLQSKRRYSVLGTYAATKLEMLMFTRELAKRLRGTAVTANAVHPGIVRTQMMLSAPGVLRVVSYLSLPFSVSPERGARTSLHLASSPELRGVSGEYFASGKPTIAHNRYDTEENRALLWQLSEEAVRASAASRAREAS